MEKSLLKMEKLTREEVKEIMVREKNAHPIVANRVDRAKNIKHIKEMLNEVLLIPTDYPVVMLDFNHHTYIADYASFGDMSLRDFFNLAKGYQIMAVRQDVCKETVFTKLYLQER